MWIKRLPDKFRDLLIKSRHNTDIHVGREIFHLPDRSFYLDLVFDFGVDTFRIFKDKCTFEDARFNAYRTAKVSRPVVSAFPAPGAVQLLPLAFPNSKE